ncbi:MAG TPA: hypothetical protein VLT33_02825 [Labilithrix sp.]|nr:hypothetical protein [Labilithrix sp.]
MSSVSLTRLWIVSLMGAVACGFDGVATGPNAASSGGTSDAGPAGGDGGVGPTDDGGAQADGEVIFLDAAGGPELTLTSGAPAPQVDLEQEGTVAWIHWGTTTNDEESLNEKASAVSALLTYSVTGSSDIRTYEDNFTSFRWTNGTPMATQGGTRNGVYSKTGKPKFHLNRVVGVEPQRWVIYAGAFKCKALLSVTLGTGPTAQTATATIDNADHGYVRYVIDHRAKAPATPLAVTWELTDAHDPNNSNVTLAAATLAPLP